MYVMNFNSDNRLPMLTMHCSKQPYNLKFLFILWGFSEFDIENLYLCVYAKIDLQ